MLVNIALKFPRISRPRPVLATVITAFFAFEGGVDNNEKLGNGLELSLILRIIFLQLRLKFMVNKIFT